MLKKAAIGIPKRTMESELERPGAGRGQKRTGWERDQSAFVEHFDCFVVGSNAVTSHVTLRHSIREARALQASSCKSQVLVLGC